MKFQVRGSANESWVHTETPAHTLAHTHTHLHTRRTLSHTCVCAHFGKLKFLEILECTQKQINNEIDKQHECHPLQKMWAKWWGEGSVGQWVVLCHVLWLICVLKSALRLCCIYAPRISAEIWQRGLVLGGKGWLFRGVWDSSGVTRSVSSSDSVQNLCALQVSNYFYSHERSTCKRVSRCVHVLCLPS